LEGVRRVLKCHPDKARLATTGAEAYANKEAGLFSIFLGLENGQALGDSLDRINEFYDAGVRYITLCHSKNNQICDSCAEGGGWLGLSRFGKDVVRQMNRLNMLVDVSHISDHSFYDVLETSVKPVVATHSCCRSICSHPRNMTDEMIRNLAEAGGVIQINFYPLFLDEGFKAVLENSGIMEYGERVESEFIADPASVAKRSAWNKVQAELQALKRPSYRLIADHIDHVVELVGIDHVGIGSDYDGIEVTPEGMEDISRMPLLFEELKSRGYTDNDLSKIASDNFFRILA
jgi:membrane dipeptidase